MICVFTVSCTFNFYKKMKYHHFTATILSMTLAIGAMAAQPEWEHKPIEIIRGHLPKPHCPTVWTAQDNGFDGWQIEGDVKLETSPDFCLWNEKSAKLTFNSTPCRAVLKPANIILNGPVDGLEIWVYGLKSGKTKNSFVIEDANGKSFTLRTTGNSSFWASTPWWGASLCRIPKDIVFPVKLTQIVFEASEKIKAGDATFFDFIGAFKFTGETLPDTAKWDIPFPYKKESILPTPTASNVKNSFHKEQDAFIFTFNGSDGNLAYRYIPKTGTLNDLSVSFNGQTTFHPMADSGIMATVNGVKFHPSDNDIQATLLKSETDGDTLKTLWKWTKNNASVEFTLGFAVKGRSLVITADSTSTDITAFSCGHTQSTPNPRLVKLTYLNYRWDYPRLLVTDDYFISLFPDWYVSQATEVVDGANRHGLQGAKIIDDDSAIILGGSLYLPKAGSIRNPLHERFFLTISPDLESVLPNIPNPRSRYFDETKTLIYSTRMYDSVKTEHCPQEVDFWRLMADYGMTDMFVRFHMNQWRTPLRNNHFTHYGYAYEDVTDAGYQMIASELKKIIKRVGPYEDNRVIHELGPEFNYDILSQNSEGLFNEGWDASFQPSPAAQHKLEADYAPFLVKKFGWNACYFDEVTNTPPWGLVDFNPNIPGSATYLNVLRNYAFVSQKMADYYNGPIWSEGNAAMFWAGYLDTDYAQTNDADAMPIVDYKLRKMNPLENLNGYDLGKVGNATVDYMLSAQIVNGNMGHLWSSKSAIPYHGQCVLKTAKPEQIRDICRSYFMMRQLQELYAGVPVNQIRYECGGQLLTATEMLRMAKPNEGKVFTQYENGLNVWVNRNPQDNWTVTVDGQKMVLPPYGYAAFMPDKLWEYSAEINGHRVDYSHGPLYTYVDGRGNRTVFPEITAAHAYVIRHDGQSKTVTPVPFIEAETITVHAIVMMPLSRDNGSLSATVKLGNRKDGTISFTTSKDVFKYAIQ